MAESLRQFPFTDEFSELVVCKVTFARVRALVYVLEPIIDHLVEVGHRDIANAGKVVPALLYAMAARARIAVACAYESELNQVLEYGQADVVLAMQEEWRAMVERDQLAFSRCTDDVVAILAPVIQTAWQPSASETVFTAGELVVAYGELMDDVRVVEVGDVLVAGDKGRYLSELKANDMLKPLLPVEHYRVLLSRRSLSGDTVIESPWDYLLLDARQRGVGFCYQYLFHPGERQLICDELGAYPYGSVVTRAWLLRYSDEREWTEVPAILDVSSDVSHVITPGMLSSDTVLPPDKRVGGEPVEEVDYFARALVDDFIARHKRKDSHQAVNVPPVDKVFGGLTLSDPGSRPRSGFEQVAIDQYALIGETVSPQLMQAGFGDATYGDSVAVHSERDSARLVELCERLDSGAAIPESYYERSKLRFSLGRRRPSMHGVGGQVYHVFAGFSVEQGGAGMGAWVRDEQWHVPGWTSYTAVFKPGASYSLAYVGDGDVADIRMDCTGDGDIYLGQCVFPSENTVLWFTNSIRFELRARTRVVLRVSVPASGSALAIGNTMRRYMHIPGYAIAARRFSVTVNREAEVVRLRRERGADVHAGCQLYSGALAMTSGRHRLRLSGLASSQPIKLLVKADPVEAFTYLGVCGIRVEPRMRDYSSVVFDLRDGDISISLRHEARVVFSVLQIVNVTEFDITVRSKIDAQSQTFF